MNLKSLRSIAFTFFAGIFALASLLLLEGLTEGLLPWTTLGCPGCPDDVPYNLDLQRWHGAEHGALLGVLFAGALICLLWRARQKRLLLQFYVVGHVLLIAGLVPFRPASTPDSSMVHFVGGILVAVALLVGLYPARRDVFSFSGAAPSGRLLVAAGISALVLVPLAVVNLQRQLEGVGGDSAAQARWIEAAILAVVLVVAMLLTATRRPGWQTLGVLTSLAYVYLGVAALSIPDQPGSWGIVGGIAALAGGLAYAGLVLAEGRRAASTAVLTARLVTP
ncbi:MAG: hypothetical protein JO057_01145 [Chloroflexi bacterium]|nr:hypothetical protein [Chloroflexota bacterium]